MSKKESGRTYQQDLVFSRLSEGIKSLESANESLETKATTILFGSTSAVAFISSVNVFPQSIIETSCVEAVLVVLLCISALVMFWFAANLWGPFPSSVPCGYDVDLMYDNYIAKSEDEAFNNALMDSAKVFEHLEWANKKKGESILQMFNVLKVQVVILGLGVVAKVTGPGICEILSEVCSGVPLV